MVEPDTSALSVPPKLPVRLPGPCCIIGNVKPLFWKLPEIVIVLWVGSRVKVIGAAIRQSEKLFAITPPMILAKSGPEVKRLFISVSSIFAFPSHCKHKLRSLKGIRTMGAAWRPPDFLLQNRAPALTCAMLRNPESAAAAHNPDAEGRARIALHDKQSERDHRELRIDKVGVRGLRFPIQVRDKAHSVQNTVATIGMYVDLPKEFKGTHMSRFLEVLNAH